MHEDFHGLEMTDAALETAVDKSIKFITDKKLPDKAIDVIDEAGMEKPTFIDLLFDFHI